MLLATLLWFCHSPHLEVLIDGGKQHLLSVLVGDVLDHQGGAPVLSSRNLLQVQSIQLLL